MGVIVNGIGVGFFAAFFISIYADVLFEYKLPFVIIYGIIAPLMTAISIIVMETFKKKDDLESYESSEKE